MVGFCYRGCVGGSADKYDAGQDGFIDLMELKLMMEKLGAPQTHLGLKSMIKEVDEDIDGKLSFREFLLIFHKAAAGELQEDSGLMALAKLSEIDVALEGVKGAKNFFEAKCKVVCALIEDGLGVWECLIWPFKTCYTLTLIPASTSSTQPHQEEDSKAQRVGVFGGWRGVEL
ncbi:hypothetical protein P7K49_013447 [Saguinus oedipus]|uniref:EF-hand domain-containing protein n=1 Tax=Saguinus oedipus TaxID=9490 RepID=A0ABQ9VGB6_SAGOE|nr:hypothetical protein P7K49_013447 [Saguinus oedipus]